MSRPVRCIICGADLAPTERGRLVTGDDVRTGFACHDPAACHTRAGLPAVPVYGSGVRPIDPTAPSHAHLAAILRGHATALRELADEHDAVASVLEESR